MVALPEATPSPFGTATLRLAPSALAALGLHSAAKCAPRRATQILKNNSLAITKNFDKISTVFIWVIINHISKPPILKA